MAELGEAVSRKTFRLDPDVAQLLLDRAGRFGTENATLNGLLRALVKMEKKAANDDIFYASQQTKIDEANETARQWKEKHGQKCAELQQLQAALSLIGKFLLPPSL